MPKLTPVEGDPFQAAAPNLTPVEADPFAGGEGGPATSLGRALESAANYAGNLGGAILDGVTFNNADEMRAGVRGAIDAVTGGPGYDARLDESRGIRKKFAEEHPAANFAGEVGGSLLGLGKLAKLARYIDVPTKVGQSVAAGTSAGALGGFGAGEGGLENRLGSAGRGAGLGLGLGLAIPAAAALVKGGYGVVDTVGTAARSLTGAYSPERRALDKIADKIAESGKTPAELQAIVQENATGAGKPLALVDVGGDQTTRLGRTVADMPGPGSSKIKSFIEERDLGTGANPLTRTGGAADRIAGDLESTFGDKLFHATDDALMTAQKDAAGPLYKAFEALPAAPADAFASVLGRPAFQDALKKAVTIAKNEGEPGIERAIMVGDDGLARLSPTIPPRVADYIKKGLDDVIDGQTDAITGKISPSGRSIVGLKKEFLDTADKVFEGYKDARNAWAGPASARDALKAGRNAINDDAADVTNAFKKMDPGDQEMFRVGFKKALFDKVKSTPDGADELKRIVGTPAMRERMGAILSPDEYGDLIGRLGSEVQMVATKRDVLGGSRTASSLADQAENLAVDLTTGAARKGATGAMIDLALKKVAEAGTMTKRTADSVATFLTETDPAKMTEIINQLQGRAKVTPSTTKTLMTHGLTRQQALTAALATQTSDAR
jgi:hypothetical protein